MHFMLLTSADSSAASSASSIIGGIIGLAIAVLYIAALWKIFVKAGKPGWAAIIPIYNYVVLLNITGHSGWWLLVGLIPGVDIIFIIVFSIIVYWDLGKAFGRSVLFRLGLIFLYPIFILILAFDSSKYIGPRGTYVALPVQYQ